MTSEASGEQKIYDLAQRLRDWGRWGEDDQLGTLNHITPAKIVEACALVRSGHALSLSIPVGDPGPQTGSRKRHNPQHLMLKTGTDALAGRPPRPHGIGVADDLIVMPLQSGTQWDSLAHIFDRGRMWNGYSASEVTAWDGARRNAVDAMADRIISRGVLLDVAGSKALPCLPDGYAITEDDLRKCMAMEGPTASVGPGDVVLIRTGHLARCRSDGWKGFADGDAPGLSIHTLDWIHSSEIAAVASDTYAVEVRPAEWPGTFSPFHQVAIPNMGLVLGEIFDLEALSTFCHQQNRYEFLFVACPLAIAGGVGSPVNPIAVM
jgi:kynurenine formamidase